MNFFKKNAFFFEKMRNQTENTTPKAEKAPNVMTVQCGKIVRNRFDVPMRRGAAGLYRLALPGVIPSIDGKKVAYEVDFQ